MMLILGIETSCDETGVAIVRDGEEILADEIASQIPLHARFGGVVPELASRAHLTAMAPMLDAALSKAGCPPQDIDAIAVTVGPGLVGALLVGLSFAKSLAYAWNKPLVPVHHLEGHIFANSLAGNPLEFPFVALVASGGHTDLIECRAPLEYKILGRTRDDAAGEAFDKVAKILGLSYPGGPAIEQSARDGDAAAFDFPRPMLSNGLDFSFSGLKTAVLYCFNDLQKSAGAGEKIPDVAASFQAAVAEVLAVKARRAMAETGLERLALAGGVIANSMVRETVGETIGKAAVFAPPPRLCVDNGAMIAAAGYHRYKAGHMADLTLNANPNLPLGSEPWKTAQRR